MTAPFIKPKVNVRDYVSPQEWEARIDLAACYRLIDWYGMSDHISNHVTVRVPGTQNEFLINPYGVLYDQMTASSMIRIDIEGNILFNPSEGYEVNRSGYIIHGAIHKARHDVDCIIHTHTLSGMTVASMQCGLLPIAQMSMRWVKSVSYHNYESIVATDERERMVRDLGDNNVMILRNHGLLTCGASIPECFNRMFWLKRACDLQVMFLSCNQQMIRLSDDVIEKTWGAYQPGGSRHKQQRQGLLEWPALLYKLDTIDPSFRE